MFILLFFSFLFLPLSHSFHIWGSCPLLIGCMHTAFLLAVCYLSCFSCVSLSLTSAFMIVGRFAPDEERLVLSKPVVQYSFTYGVSKVFLYLFINTHIISMILLTISNSYIKLCAIPFHRNYDKTISKIFKKSGTC